MNKLYYGDCLTIMADMPSACVDLIYLDPPFNSNKQYNAIYKTETGHPLPDQVEAFCDMWEMTAETDRTIREMPVLMRENGIDDSVVNLWKIWMSALRDTNPRLLAYLSYMAIRLLVMKRLLKPTGSLYIHCDPNASHYIKILLDGIFGHANFLSEIIWKRTSSHNSAHRWGPIHDTILLYSNSNSYCWNRVTQSYDDNYLKKNYRYEDEHGEYRLTEITGPGTRRGESGQAWRGVNPTERARHWAVPTLPEWVEEPDGYASMSVQDRLDVVDSAGLIDWPVRGKMPRFKRHLDRSAGVPIQDIILDINPVAGDEDMGYDTQKPMALLNRIISASSNPGDVVFDPFCGCATTIESAHKLGRKWIGIDIAIHAVKRVARIRLNESLGLVEGQDYIIEGVPRTTEGAQDLWTRDKYHFQKWAVEQVEGFVTTSRSADGGVDGRLYFAVPNNRDLQSMVIEVKGGRRVTIKDVRALRGVLDYDRSLMAGLIVLHPLGERQMRNFMREMNVAGTLDIWGIPYPRMQILTVDEIFEGKRFATPTVAGRHTLEPRMPGIPA